MDEGKRKYKIVYKCYWWHYVWLAIVIIGAVILFTKSDNMLAGLFLLIAGVAVTLIYYARSNEDEALGTRTNYELIRFYTKAAYFLFAVLGIGFLVIVIAEKIVRQLLK